jgi:hypothetical protein
VTLEAPRRYRHAPNVLSRSFSGEVLLAAAGHDGMDRLTGGASELWTVLDEPGSLSEVVAILSDVHETLADDLQPQLDGVLSDLVRRGWIEEMPDPVAKRQAPSRGRRQ